MRRQYVQGGIYPPASKKAFDKLLSAMTGRELTVEAINAI
jgi:hypothetical protein